MFLLSHLVAGLIIGKISGNYGIALLGSFIIDLDHLFPYFKNRMVFNFRKLWKAVTTKKDLYKDQRNYLHSIFSWAAISIALMVFNLSVGLVFSFAYLAHLFLDALDNADFYPLYPLRYNLKGPIDYLSIKEHLFTLFLIGVLLVI